MIEHPYVKVNLGLNVLRRRKDGYHDLETLFFPCHDCHDTLEIISSDDYSRTSAALFSRYGAEGQLSQAVSEDGRLMITVARAGGVDWNPLDDITAKAYKLLDADYCLPSVKIFLEKTSPVGAGLGGGSCDGAFALRMLSSLFSLGLGETELASYASLLGSDCPFFIYDRPMFGEGRGEILTEFNIDSLWGPDASFQIRLAIPEGVSVSTADAYRGIIPIIPQTPLREVLSLPVEQWRHSLVNDFEKTVFSKYPLLAKMKSSLYDSGAVYASMSGSGSAFYGIFRK